MIAVSFCIFLALFIFIGIASFSQSKKTTHDYLLAGSRVKPWLVGLSAVATNNSGYMFTGMIGFTYMTGLSSVWLMIGWVAGDFVGSLFIHNRLRTATEKTGESTFAGVLSAWNGTDFRKLRFVCGVISILFLGAYAAAQFNAGSKALHVLFGWDISIGAIIGSAIVMLYCFAGGIRASIWTDAAQSVVMIISMSVLLVSSVQYAGGIDASIQALNEIRPAYMNLFPDDLPFGVVVGPLLFVAGWFFAGFGVIGQPHIMIRFMALDNPSNMTKARVYYYLWFTLFYAITIGVGLLARILIPETGIFDAELALPTMSLQILPPILVGLMLAGLFAATISTADSLILSCSASLTRDLSGAGRESYILTKLGTLAVTAIALFIALTGNKSVFKLVLYAWAVMGSAFGPLLVIYCLKQKITENTAIGMVLTGMLVSIGWSVSGLSSYVYEILPGILSGLAVYVVFRNPGNSSSKSLT